MQLQAIDLDQVTIDGIAREGFRPRMRGEKSEKAIWYNYIWGSWFHIPSLECHITPGMALHLEKSRPDTFSPVDPELLEYGWFNERVMLRRDLRQDQLWRLGVLMYELLHGYSPWEDPEYHHNEPVPDLRAIRTLPGILTPDLRRLTHARNERRNRVVNDDLPTREDLSQDCVDVLQALFRKEDITSFGKKTDAQSLRRAVEASPRPTIEELVTFAWFQGSFTEAEEAFERPCWIKDLAEERPSQ